VLSFSPAEAETLVRYGTITPRTMASAAKMSFRFGSPGYTLVEIMIVVAIIGTLAAIAIPAFAHAMYRVQVTRAINDIRVLGGQIDIFEFENARVPDDLNEIGRGGLKDPWGRPYVYLSFQAAGDGWKGAARKDHSLVPLNTSYDLYSVGKDGKSAPPLTAKASDDDIVRADDGGYIGLGANF
jgi:general secretion pathway protein G